MYEYLKALFGTGEDGAPIALTFDQLTEKLANSKDIKLVNLTEGGYVSADKFNAKVTELEGVQTQLADANAQIKAFNDMDVEGIKKSVSDWETKYNTDTAALQQKLSDQEYEFAAKTYLGGYKYTSDLVRDAIFSKFMEKKFSRENEKFLGADDFMAEMQKNNPSAFVVETPPEGDPNGNHGGNGAPYFAPQKPPAPAERKKTLTELMKYKNEHPDAKINYD